MDLNPAPPSPLRGMGWHEFRGLLACASIRHAGLCLNASLSSSRQFLTFLGARDGEQSAGRRVSSPRHGFSWHRTRTLERSIREGSSGLARRKSWFQVHAATIVKIWDTPVGERAAACCYPPTRVCHPFRFWTLALALHCRRLGLCDRLGWKSPRAVVNGATRGRSRMRARISRLFTTPSRTPSISAVSAILNS